MSANFDNHDTIVAIATPHGTAGIGIIRISGASALSIARKLTNQTLEPRHATNIKVSIPNSVLTDYGIGIYFRAPHSFTGEDIVELQLHSNPLLLDRILAYIATMPSTRLSDRGEFTRRALLNGKLSLSGAENLIDLIHAESDAEIIATTIGSDDLHLRMTEIEKSLIEISAQIEGALDHPEEVQLPNIKPAIQKFIQTLETFTRDTQTSHYIYSGISVAILGKPNAGKSSLFNALLGHDRSIVTDIAGTTTDTVSETAQIDGFKVRLIDTAGIRDNPRDQIEKLGISRALASARQCDIALCFDETAIRLAQSENKPYIAVNRASDINAIKHEIITKTIGSIDKIQNKTIANARQLNELYLATVALKSALSTTETDLIASDIATALYHISNITGTNATEAVLDEIFSRFCLGK